MGKEIKTFCKSVAEHVRDGRITAHQGKTIIGQAKSGNIDEAKRGLSVILNG